LSLKVTSSFLYPIAVAVSALTTLFTPYLIKAADPITRRIARSMPVPVANTFGLYSQWLASLSPDTGGPTLFTMTRRIVVQIAVNLALVAAIFLTASYAAPFAAEYLLRWLPTNDAQRVALWSAALLISMPFLVAVYRKLGSLALMLAEVSVQPAKAGRFTRALRSAISGLIPILAMFGVFLLVTVFSGGILPRFGLMIAVLVCAALLLTVLWRWCVKIHATMQIALRETFEEPRDHP
jgi:monovalent cation:H+ antiporter-2, CPA2 family